MLLCLSAGLSQTLHALENTLDGVVSKESIDDNADLITTHDVCTMFYFDIFELEGKWHVLRLAMWCDKMDATDPRFISRGFQSSCLIVQTTHFMSENSGMLLSPSDMLYHVVSNSNKTPLSSIRFVQLTKEQSRRHATSSIS